MTWQDYAVIAVGIYVTYYVISRIIRFRKKQKNGESPCSSCSSCNLNHMGTQEKCSCHTKK